MTRLGYQIPNFTYPGTRPADLFDVISRQAREADEAGFDTVLVMDHFYQLPMLGDPDDYGDPDTVAGQFAQDLSTGVDGFTINLPANGHMPGRVARLGETLAPLISDG